MSKRNDYGHEDRREASMWMGWGWSQVLVGVLIVTLLGAVIWGASVFFSDVKGRGDALREKNSGTNRVQAQELFQQRYNDILAANARITIMRDARDADPTDKTARQNYTGALSYCVGLVGRYNADAGKYSLEDFRDTSLPRKIVSKPPAGPGEEVITCKGES